MRKHTVVLSAVMYAVNYTKNKSNLSIPGLQYLAFTIFSAELWKGCNGIQHSEKYPSEMLMCKGGYKLELLHFKTSL